MPHAFHNGTGNCETCRFLAKLAMNPKGADASSSNSSEDLSRSRDVPQPAERESSQLPEAMEAEMAVVPWGPMVGGYPEPATSIPTVEEVLQSTGTLGESYPEGVKSDSDGDFPVKSDSDGDIPPEDPERWASDRDVPPEDPAMWVRRENPQPSGGTAAAAEVEQHRVRAAWLRISGSPEVMEEFRKELARREPKATVFEPAVVLGNGNGTRVHRMDCSLLSPSKRHTHLLCPECTSEMKSSDERLVCDNHQTIHSTLSCKKLQRTAASKLLSWCNVCHFSGLGSASNLGPLASSSSVETPFPSPEWEPMDAAIEAARLEGLARGSEDGESEGSWTEDEAASDPPSEDGDGSERDAAPFEI